MKLHIFTSIPVLLLIDCVNTLNVLGIFPYQGKSHFLQYKILLNELATRGHNVTVISYFPEENARPNYRDISIGDTKILEDDVPMDKNYFVLLATGFYLSVYGMDNCKALVSSPGVQDLLKNATKFDVVIVEQFNSDCALGIAYKIGAPVVGVTSHVLMPFHYNRFGIPSNPAYVPFHFLEGGTKPTLYQRLERAVFNLYFKCLYTYVQWTDRKTLIEQFGEIPPLEDLAKEIKFLLLYQNMFLTGSRLLPANVIEVNGYHVPKPKPLSGDLKRFIDESEHGVVFISFGSMIKCSTLPFVKKEAIMMAMNEFPQRFIWRCDDDSLKVDKNKVHISNWLPQVDLLAHPKTLVFLSHGGMGGTTEAIYNGVPMIAVPIFGDQPSNAFAIQESGLGVHLDFNDLNKESLVLALKKVLDITFRQNTKRLSRAWHDRPMSPLDLAVYWTEFAARNANFTYRTPAADTPFYQHLQLDIAAVLIAFITTIVYALKLIIYMTCGNKKSMVPKKAQPKKGKKMSKRE